MAIFALDLDHDGIRLLRDAGGGWDVVDHVALDDSKLSGRLRRMRHTAVLATDANLETILIIPNWQIFYTTLSLPSDGLPADEEWITASLDGMTGCPVDEMKFDWRTTPAGVHVAALDINTLDEAESFATQHGFNPVRFSARPAAEDFPDMPDFGPTEFVRHQAAQEQPVLFESRRAPEATNAFADIAEPEPAPTFASTRAEPEIPAITFESSRHGPLPELGPEPQPEPVELEAGPSILADAPALPAFDPAEDAVSLLVHADPEVAGRVPPVLHQPEIETAPDVTSTAPSAPVAPSADDDAATLPNALDATALVRTTAQLLEPLLESLPETDEQAPPALEQDADTEVADEPLVEVEPVAEVEEIDAADWVEEEASSTESTAAEELEEQVAEAPEDSVDAEEAFDDPVEPAAEEPEAVEEEPEPEDEPALASVTPVAPPPIHIGAAQLPTRTVRPVPGAQRERPANDETLRRGPAVFRLEPEEPKPTDWKAIGLTTGAAASVIAALVWTALTLVAPEDEFAVIAERGLPNPLATPESPAAPSANAEMDPPITRMVPDVQTVNFDPTAPSADRGEMQDRRMVTLGPDAVETSQPPTSDPNAVRAANIWMTPPPAPPDPVGESLDRLYLAAIDPAIPIDDALALPQVTFDAAPPVAVVAAPPALGQEFDLDERGLVRATPEGAQTPDGVTVYAGLPGLVPPTRPAPEVVEPVEQAPLELAGRLPRLRPSDLIQRNERTQWGGRTLQELAGLRPETRPSSVQDQAPVQSASLFPSDYAVSVSRLPSSRPTDFQAVVAAAQARASQAASRVAAAAAPQPQQQQQQPQRAVASAEPDIPTTASVARQATISNAINLRRVNLIGVYGSASNRRALVRLPSGRYRKVQVGDSVDGGRVRQINEGQLIYTKGGRNVTLSVPSG